MEIPDKFNPLLWRSPLEIRDIVYLAYGLDPNDWPNASSLTREEFVELQTIFRDIKAAIKRGELPAVPHGNDVDYLANRSPNLVLESSEASGGVGQLPTWVPIKPHQLLEGAELGWH